MSSTSAAAGTRFRLSPSSFLKIEKGDVTQWFVDGSSDAIPYIGLQDLNRKKHAIKYQKFGLVSAALQEKQGSPRFKLPVSHVIHTVGPVYDVDPNPKASLTRTYRNSLAVAKDNKIQYIAFPAISCGFYGYPYEEAASVAISTIKEFADGIKEVHFVLFLGDIYEVWLKKAKELLQV